MQRRLLLPTTILATALTLAACATGGSTSGSSTDSTAATETVSTAAADADVSQAAEEAEAAETAAAEAEEQASQAESEASDDLLPDEQEDADSGWTQGKNSLEAATDSELVVTQMRVGEHEDFDRVVLEFSGEGSPGWDARWTQEAATQGKGDPIEVDGEYQLTIIGTGVIMPVGEDPGSYLGISDLTLDGSGLREAYYDPTYEAQYQLVIGTDSQDYRIFALTDPTRLVVDIKHSE